MGRSGSVDGTRECMVKPERIAPVRTAKHSRKGKRLRAGIKPGPLRRH